RDWLSEFIAFRSWALWAAPPAAPATTPTLAPVAAPWLPPTIPPTTAPRMPPLAAPRAIASEVSTARARAANPRTRNVVIVTPPLPRGFPSCFQVGHIPRLTMVLLAANKKTDVAEHP